MLENALYQTQQVMELEKLAINAGRSAYDLMKAAATAAFRGLQQTWPKATTLCICCGKGNNAGDGYVLAQMAAQQGMRVQLIYLVDPASLSGPAQQALADCSDEKVTQVAWHEALTLDADVIVDALLGTGLRGQVSDDFAGCVAQINAASAPVLALDVPSGLDANTGCVHGCAVKADLTVTFIGNKQGLHTAQGPEHSGRIVVDSLNLNAEFYQSLKPAARLLCGEIVKQLLPRRARTAHKGCYGHVLVIGGDYGMGGAVRMAAEAALRVGAGLVSVATRPEHVAIVAGHRPEIMAHQVRQAAELEPLLERATVVVIGPGLGQTDWARDLLARVASVSLPKLIDADGLNLLAQQPSKCNDWVLTPHPGEAGRLLEMTSAEVQENRFHALAQIQQKYGGTVVLKGAGTLIKSEDKSPAVCNRGNPGMATGGMGDILSGVIAGLMAQGLTLAEASEAGVYLHALAADRAVAQCGERGLMATDLLSWLRRAVNPDDGLE